MSKPDLSTVEGVLEWANVNKWNEPNFDTETAAYISECVRVAEITASAAAGPFDNTPEGRTASRRIMTRLVENERLRVAFEGMVNSKGVVFCKPGDLARLRDAMKGEDK